ncbi:helix-turn-helix domain-containing protein [Winogradskyella sp. PC D3.3]
MKSITQLFKNEIFVLKTVLTFEEACFYSGLAKSTMYKLTSSNEIPHYKPKGKLIFFKKEELENWLLQNRQESNENLENEALKYSLKNNKH